jgi:DNA sulfur modification protein DndC
MPSLFEGEEPPKPTTEETYAQIREVYLRYPHPWVVGFSGGKDSTTVLQMVWYALSALPAEQLTKSVHVISTDTLVETPVIVDQIDSTLHRINETAQRTGMPFRSHKLVPRPEDTFWVNLIGRGYPAPGSNFRWCTDRLKIQPSNRFILEKVAEHGEVILVLGTRRGESASRDQVINLHQVRGHALSRHGTLPGAWVYMPIEHFSTDDVWRYLLQVPSPWGGDNRSLASVYRTAQSGECPLVIDKTTPSCGNSRFGCWTCTVVTRDRSMQAMIDSGEEWLEPLLDFRDWLASTLISDQKHIDREYKSRDGRIKILDDGRVRYRTYTLAFCKTILRRLLQAQRDVWKHDPEFALISEDELREIRRIWLTERQDWEDALPGICSEALPKAVRFDAEDISAPGRDEAHLLHQLAEQHGAPVRLVQKLLDAERAHYGMRRRATIHTTISRVLAEDWRTLEEALEDHERERGGPSLPDGTDPQDLVGEPQ